MQHLPVYISAFFVFVTLATILLFYKAAHRSPRTLLIILLWLAMQGVISLTGFYAITNGTPPRFALLIIPPLVLIIALFCTPKGRQYIDSLNTGWLTLLHFVRVPVELTLFWLFLHKAVPQEMTFEGKNFDILSGLSAPVIFYYGFVRKKMNKQLLITWNIICLLLLINIVGRAILSAPFPFQQLAFDQPNVAILHFPFVWLPGCVVPLVLLSHLTVIRRCINAQPAAQPQAH